MTLALDKVASIRSVAAEYFDYFGFVDQIQFKDGNGNEIAGYNPNTNNSKGAMRKIVLA